MISTFIQFLVTLYFIGSTIGEFEASGPPLETLKQWNLLTFNLPWDYPADVKEYNNPENVIATGLAIGNEKLFIATPRLYSGVAATISFVPKEDYGDSPILQAYPDWSFHTAGRNEYNCSDMGLISVYRMRIDSCNRLWALDAAVSQSIENFQSLCPPKILVFDLNTDQVVRRIDFPPEVVRGESLFTNMIIDETSASPDGNCDDVFVYISDTVEPAIVVYDSDRDLTWRLIHPSMYPDPNYGQTNILGHRFTLMDGVVGLAFDAHSGIVYFQPLATDRLFSITTTALQAGPIPFGTELPIKLVGKKSSQGIGIAVAPYDGTIFFSPLTETAIAQYNPFTNKQKILAYDQERLQFAADIRAPSTEPGSLYILSSKFHRFYLKNLDTNDINTRILRIQSVAHHHPTGTFPSSTAFSTNKPNLINNHKPSVNGYFNSIRQPYAYEQLGIINKSINNPFFLLNTGERPESYRKPPHTSTIQPVEYGYYNNHHYYPKINSKFNDFNGLRLTKSIKNNSTSRF